jgi:hypothetical protein
MNAMSLATRGIITCPEDSYSSGGGGYSGGVKTVVKEVEAKGPKIILRKFAEEDEKPKIKLLNIIDNDE